MVITRVIYRSIRGVQRKEEAVLCARYCVNLIKCWDDECSGCK